MVLTARAAALVAAVLVLAACGSAAGEPPAAPAVAVELPAGAEPEVLAVAGGSVLIGIRRGARPGLLRRGPGGVLAELPIRPSTGYGATASWYALAADGDRVLAVGGDRGGAHGNVRWSAWSGSTAGIAEHTQAFSVFGGWGAGDLVGAVFAPSGPVLVGSWESAAAGDDVAVWNAAGDEWSRLPSTGTALASSRTTLNFPIAATRTADGVLVAGWQAGPAGQTPVVWSNDGAQWSSTALPDAGHAGIALEVSCAAASCAAVGRVDGQLALWRLLDGRWSRVTGLPPIAVGDLDPVAAPLLAGARIVQLAADPGGVVALDVPASGEPVSRRIDAATGPVRAAVAVGADAYVVAGAPARLWAVPGLMAGGR